MNRPGGPAGPAAPSAPGRPAPNPHSAPHRADAAAATLAFHGGAGTVTGSRHLLDAAGLRVLVDVGLFQGLKELRERNWQQPGFDPASVDQLLLTHIHIDHAGYLPKLVREGYRGPVHCTPATAELAPLLLMDAAKIQEEDAQYANKRGFSRHSPALPLYDARDAERALTHLRSIDYGERLTLSPRVSACYHNAGHILGSAHVEVRIDGNGGPFTVLFSGDVGRYDMPLHVDPVPPPPCDVLVIESTYGDRTHPSAPFADQIREPLAETFQRNGVVLIPAFAVGRAQQITLILRDMMRAGNLPDVPIHLDSPMAVDATEIYARHLRDHNLDEGLGEEDERRRGDGGFGPAPKRGDGGTRGSGNRLFPRNVFFHRSVEESKALNALRGPRVIISASGMLTAGRILHHLAQRAPAAENLVVLVGFQAEGTRGRALERGAMTLRIHGMEVPVNARVLAVHGLSGHADQAELLRWVKSGTRLPRRVFITHGEPDSSAALAQRLRTELGLRVDVPAMGQTFSLE